MAMFYKPPPGTPGGGPPEGMRPVVEGPPLVEMGPPPPVIDPEPWIEVVLPPEEEKIPPIGTPPEPVLVVIDKPPVILPPPPDITPESIVPIEVEQDFPTPLPEAPTPEKPGGHILPAVPPPSIIPLAGLAPVGTFMVYLGRRLLLTMAASVGSQLGSHFGAMLVGPLGKTMSRGVRLRYHTGVSPGAMGQIGEMKGSAVSYMDAWRQTPAEFSYWEK